LVLGGVLNATLCCDSGQNGPIRDQKTPDAPEGDFLFWPKISAQGWRCPDLAPLDKPPAPPHKLPSATACFSPRNQGEIGEEVKPYGNQGSNHDSLRDGALQVMPPGGSGRRFPKARDPSKVNPLIMVLRSYETFAHGAGRGTTRRTVTSTTGTKTIGAEAVAASLSGRLSNASVSAEYRVLLERLLEGTALAPRASPVRSGWT
jgi:hypothetical protein